MFAILANFAMDCEFGKVFCEFGNGIANLEMGCEFGKVVCEVGKAANFAS